jgi:hypothetical protein
MVFGLAGPWTDQTDGSVAKLNLMMVISGPGADLAALPKSQHVLMKCTLDGGGLVKDHVYQTSTDATSLIDVTGIASHTHSSNATGGTLVDIFRGNSKLNDLSLTRTTDLKKASWIETAFTGGTAEDTIDGTTGERSIRLRTNATLAAAYTLQYPHLKLDFSKRSFFQCKVRIETLSSLALRTGVNGDLVTAVDSNTAKYNIEVCTATNNNWQVRTASGTNKSMSDTGTLATTNRTGIKLEHYPDLAPPVVDTYIGTGTVFQKSGDVPITGASADNNLVIHSIKNSVAADRVYHLYGARVVYYVSDTWV